MDVKLNYQQKTLFAIPGVFYLFIFLNQIINT